MEPPPGTLFLPLTNSPQVAIIDEEDWDKVSRYRWNLTTGGYIRTGIRNKTLLLHRLVMNAKADQDVDHIFLNKLDNTKAHLRFVTQSQNNANTAKRAGTSSRFKGVSWNRKSNKWRAGIMIRGVTIHLGMHEDELEAGRAYDRRAIQEYGHNALVNFPNDQGVNFHFNIDL